MIWNLLSATSGSASDSTGTPAGGCNYSSLLMILLLVGVMVVFYFINRRSQKKREEELNNTLDAIQPGCKVKTIGGICGVVVEVCPEDNTFILETGSEASGKSYMKFDKKAVYQTDAVPVPAVTEAPVEEPVEEPVEAPVEEPVEAPVDETKGDQEE